MLLNLAPIVSQVKKNKSEAKLSNYIINYALLTGCLDSFDELILEIDNLNNSRVHSFLALVISIIYFTINI